MFESLGRFVYRGRWTLLVLSVVAAVLVAPFGLELFGRMVDGGFEDPSADSTTAAHWNDKWYSGNSPDVVVLYTSASASVKKHRGTVHDSLRALPARHVRTMVTYWTSGSKQLLSKDGRSTYALITLRGGSETKQRGYEAIEDRLRRVDGLTVKIGGSVPLVKDLNVQTGKDLARAEAISLPILLVLLVLVFGSLIAAGLPLLVGMLSVLGALVLLRLLTEVTDVSVFSLNVVTMLGLGLAIDYSLFVLSAFREEIGRGVTTEEAVVRTMATAGRTVAFSGLTVATALCGLLLFPQMFLRSIGLGAAAVVLVAMLSALLVLPAVLGILGRRVNAIRITPRFGAASSGPESGSSRNQRRPPSERDHEHGATRGEGGAWHAVASSVMKRPVLYLVGVSALLVALAVPFLHVEFGNVDARVLPAHFESRQVAESIDASFARNSMAAIDVHVLIERDFAEQPQATGPLERGHSPVSPVTAITPADVAPFTDRLERLPGVTGVDLTGLSQDNGSVRLAVRYTAEPISPEANRLVTLIRSMEPEPNFRSVIVGGSTAAQMDLLDSLAATLPWMALVVCGVTGVLLFAAFGSLLLPLKAILMNVLSLGASFGVIVWAFQDGHLASVLGFTSTGTIEATVTVLILAVVFGLSMDYELFLLSRVRAEWLRTGDNTQAVAVGLQKTGGIITSAALLLLVVIGAFSTAEITIVKLLGVGMFVAIVVDATLVRALLVPATMRLMGNANWWLPRPLRGLHRRIEIREPASPSVEVTRLPGPPPAVLSPAAPIPMPSPRRVVRPNLDGPGWHWADVVDDLAPPSAGPVVFGADTDPIPPIRKHPYSAPEPEPEGGWVKVCPRTRVVRAGPDGSGWTWAEAEE